MITRHCRNLAPAAIAVLLSAGAVSAATVSFDLTGSDTGGHASLPSSFSMADKGITATFKAGSFTALSASGGPSGGFVFDTASFATDPRIGRDGSGAGVTSSASDTSSTVDGRGGADFIEMEFSEDVTLTRLVFGAVSDNDDFQWMFDLNGDGRIGVGDFLSAARNDDPLSGFTTYSGRVWGVLAAGTNDNWTLNSVTVAGPAVIPLPAGLPLLLGGLGSLAVLRRRRKT